MSPACMLYLTVPPALEEPLADWLLDDDSARGFTCVHAFGHGESTAAMSLSEQIAGRVRRVQFQLLCRDAQQADDLLDRVATAFGGSDIHYWKHPVSGHGHIGPS